MTLKKSLKHKINLQKNIGSEPSSRQFWEIGKKLLIWTSRVIQYVQWSSVTLSKRPLLCSILKLFSDMVHLAILGATAPFKGKDKKSNSGFFYWKLVISCQNDKKYPSKLNFSIHCLLFALKFSVEAHFSILAKILLLCWCQKSLKTFYNLYWLLVRFFYTYLCSKWPKRTIFVQKIFCQSLFK